MSRAIQLREPAWWVWLFTVAAIGAGLAGHKSGLVAAILVSVAQTVFFRSRHGSFAPYAVQIRLAYTLLLVACLWPPLRWLFWLPALGTIALLVLGYCLMARFLSIMPWNLRHPLSLDLLRRTFLNPPVVGHVSAGLGGSGCPGGVCELEAGAAAPRIPAPRPPYPS